MLHRWKSITVFLNDSPEGARVGQLASQVAAQHQSHLIGVYGLTHAITQNASTAFVRGDSAIAAAARKLHEEDQQKLLAAGQHLGRVTGLHGISGEFRVFWNETGNNDALFHSLHTDLVIVSEPTAAFPSGWSAERLVLEAGVPVLQIPHEWKGEKIADNVVVAWNGSREARRAIADAMPFLTAASRVSILVVDAEEHSETFGDEPGSDMARHLMRHDIQVEVIRATTGDGDVARAIQSQTIALQAGLIVIGAYSHSRSAEMIFGGVTRTLLKNSSVPLFVSR